MGSTVLNNVIEKFTAARVWSQLFALQSSTAISSGPVTFSDFIRLIASPTIMALTSGIAQKVSKLFH